MVKEEITSQSSYLPVYNLYVSNRRSALLQVACHIKFFEWANIAGKFNANNVMKEFNWPAKRGADAFLISLYAVHLIQRCDLNENCDWGDEHYELTDISKTYLIPGKPYYLGDLVELEFQHPITGKNLLKVLQEGRPDDFSENKDIWENSNSSEEEAAFFTRAMHSISAQPSDNLSKNSHIDWSKYNVFVDVAGGSGVFTTSLLKQFNHMKGIILELPNVCKFAQLELIKNGIADRAKCEACDLFEGDYPTHYDEQTPCDIYFFSQILHDWNVPKGLKLMKKTYDALPEGGIIMIHEKLISKDRSGPEATVLTTLDMLTWCDGQQYTFEKLQEMLISTGFKNVKFTLTSGYFGCVWAEK